LIFSTAYHPQIGGAELALKEITDRIKSVNFDLITLRKNRAWAPFEIIGDVRVFRVGNNLGRFDFLVPKIFFPLLALRKALHLTARGGDYETILALQASQGGGAAWLYKKIYPKTNLILNFQEGQSLDKQSFLKRFFRARIIKSADRAIAISQYLADYIKKINPKAEVVIIPNGVDFKKDRNFDTNDMVRKKLGIDLNSKVIITTSRLVEKNGLFDLIEAFERVLKDYPEIFLIIAGGGPLQKTLEVKIKDKNLAQRIKLVGEVPFELIPDYLSAADIFVRPSHSEGLGTSFLEAMTIGLPVIGTPVGGIPDFLIEGQTGLMAKVSNPLDLAGKILSLLNNPTWAQAIARRGQELVARDYSWDKIARKFEAELLA